MKNLANTLIVAAAVMAIGLGCVCGGSKPKCEAFLTTPQGKEYYGADKTKDTAIRNSCNNWCIVEDPGYTRRYEIWLETPAGKRESRLSKGKPDKVRATSDPRIMDYLYKECAPACVKKVKSGTFKVRTKCKK